MAAKFLKTVFDAILVGLTGYEVGKGSSQSTFTPNITIAIPNQQPNHQSKDEPAKNSSNEIAIALGAILLIFIIIVVGRYVIKSLVKRSIRNFNHNAASITYNANNGIPLQQQPPANNRVNVIP